MKIQFKQPAHLIMLMSLLSTTAHSHENHDPLIASVMLHKLEIGDKDNSAIEAEAWIGHDLDKFWLKTELENHSGEIEKGEIQALYSRAISPFWDVQVGLRQDVKPEPSRTWGVIGVQGLAPYFFEMDATLFIGESGHAAARISAEYDVLFTHRLILSPEIEIKFFGQNDVATNTGSGLSTIETGLRLRYEIRREFAPYLGVTWNQKYGTTKDVTRDNNEAVNERHWTIGLRAWF